jgi:hydroxyacylglutathione hydrolase
LKEQKLIPFAHQYLEEGQEVPILGTKFKILDLSGHTLGHIGYWNPEEHWLFSGDVLFSLGCGRIFDGTVEDHYRSLEKIKNLPPETWVYCTHEYTELNLKFCLQRFPKEEALKTFAEKVQALRHENKPTVPFPLQQELELNPFLKTHGFEEFRLLREERNHF